MCAQSWPTTRRQSKILIAIIKYCCYHSQRCLCVPVVVVVVVASVVVVEVVEQLVAHYQTRSLNERADGETTALVPKALHPGLHTHSSPQRRTYFRESRNVLMS